MKFTVKLLALPLSLLMVSANAWLPFSVFGSNWKTEVTSNKVVKTAEQVLFEEARDAYWAKDYIKCRDILSALKEKNFEATRSFNNFDNFLENSTIEIEKANKKREVELEAAEKARTAMIEDLQSKVTSGVNSVKSALWNHKGKIAAVVGLGVAYKLGAFEKDAFLRNNKVSNFAAEQRDALFGYVGKKTAPIGNYIAETRVYKKAAGWFTSPKIEEVKSSVNNLDMTDTFKKEASDYVSKYAHAKLQNIDTSMFKEMSNNPTLPNREKGYFDRFMNYLGYTMSTDSVEIAVDTFSDSI